MTTTVVDETDEETPDPGAAEQRTRRRPTLRGWTRPKPGARTRRLLRGAGVAAAVLFAAGFAFQSWLLFNQHRAEVAAQQALEAAQRYAVTLTTADSSTIDDQIAALIDGSTGDFQKRYTKNSTDLRTMLIANKVSTQGHVIDSAVKSADARHATVLLFVDQNFTAPVLAERPEMPPADITGMTITLEKIDGRWLVSEVVAAEPKE